MAGNRGGNPDGKEASSERDKLRREAHAQTVEVVLRALEVEARQGLSDTEVEARLAQYGPNELPMVAVRPLWLLFLDQFKSIIVLLLVLAAGVAFLTKETVEGFAILIVLLLNALVGFGTEWRARVALDALRNQGKAIARVRRGGHEQMREATQLVPGDIVVLAAGDRIPADVRLVTASAVRVEESALTGESVPVIKDTTAVPVDAPLAERHGMAYQGTTLTAGSALAVVTATGSETELGRIGKLVAESEEEMTPLAKRLDELGRRLVHLVVGIAVAVFVTGWLRRGSAEATGENSLLSLVEVALSLAVAAVPEGLPAVTTLVLALGVLRMAKQNALVRRLSAVETLGSTTVICSDKTGTLTQNRMTVQSLRLTDGNSLDTNTPLPENQPSFSTLSPDTYPETLLHRAVLVSLLCNEANFEPEASGEERAVGDPTETALLLWAADWAGAEVARWRQTSPMVEEVPFDSDTKRMISVHTFSGARVALLKGAPQAVFDLCTVYRDAAGQEQPFTLEDRKRMLEENNAMAKKALRVLALADRRLPETDTADGLESPGYTLLGLVGMIDPPRPEAAKAVQEAQRAGVRTVMLTGDQLETARAIAESLGLNNGPGTVVALHARDLESADVSRLAQLARETDVFARVSPEDKLRIVEALQKTGEIVAVTGDGVNDAPALKRADIGVAMGQRGTEVAKEAADVVLADDNFATIVTAIEGGRTIYNNILKFVHFLFTCNLSEVIVIFIAVLIGWPIPLLPLQILWVNLVTDVFPAFALAVEPAEADVMRRRPRNPKESLLSREFLGLIAWQGLLIGAVVLGAYWWALGAYGEGAHARTIALLALVGVQGAQLFNCRSRTFSGFTDLHKVPSVWGAAFFVLALQALAVYLPPLARILGTTAPKPTDWLVVAIAFVIPLVIVEIVKAVQRGSRKTETA